MTDGAGGRSRRPSPVAPDDRAAAHVRLWLLTLIWRLTGKDLSRKPLDHEVGA